MLGFTGLWFLTHGCKWSSSYCTSSTWIYGSTGNWFETVCSCGEKMGSWTSGHHMFILSIFRLLLINPLPDLNMCFDWQSRAHPREIMTEVLKALRELNVCWKKIGHYNMKCRYFSGISDHAESMFNDSPHANHSVSDESAIVESDNVSGKESSTIKFEIQVSSHALRFYIVARISCVPQFDALGKVMKCGLRSVDKYIYVNQFTVCLILLVQVMSLFEFYE